jgi:hypothetical protein
VETENFSFWAISLRVGILFSIKRQLFAIYDNCSKIGQSVASFAIDSLL